MVMVLGTAKDEQTFSNLVFMKKKDLKLFNYPPRPCCKDVFVHTFYLLEIIPFYTTICEWNVDQTQCWVEFELQCGCVTVFTKVVS
jgi:hypothetical protein